MAREDESKGEGSLTVQIDQSSPKWAKLGAKRGRQRAKSVHESLGALHPPALKNRKGKSCGSRPSHTSEAGEAWTSHPYPV